MSGLEQYMFGISQFLRLRSLGVAELGPQHEDLSQAAV